ncbi:SDR family NAD(P)-dependent oxidoreductase [uncultured Jatrophihabitans sp.]|uniref:SDR family NAD(P)-dependent oxidoreductase n=1 Tax=uncultured Jatrophihabitans sp. TaxID=1610747 RepID=UPI0035CAB645
MSGRPVAIVTGGAGAIGSAICAALEAAGHDVVSFDLRAREGHADDIVLDLADADAVRSAARRLLADRGRCDVLVHAAADLSQAALGDVDLRLWRRVQAVNVEAPLLLAQALAPALAESGRGRIVLIGSDTVWQPPAVELLPYVTSKAALIGLTRMLAMALGPADVADTVAFCVSAAGGALTGQTLCVDGGLITR